jgi:hypothetical protein
VPLLWAAREPASDHKEPTTTSRNTRWPREERTAGDGTGRTGGPLWRSPAGRRAARGGVGDFEAALGRAWPRGTSLGKAGGG